jgi:hypothetical protein
MAAFSRSDIRSADRKFLFCQLAFRRPKMLTSEQVRAARAMLRMEQRGLAAASGLSLETVKRIECTKGPISALAVTVEKLTLALEAGGVEFTNGDQPGVRMKPRGAKMMLEDSGINPYVVNESRYGFGARDGGREFQIHVSDTALNDLEPSKPRSGYLGIVMRHRRSMFEAARRLYREGRVEQGDVILVKTADLQGGYAQSRSGRSHRPPMFGRGSRPAAEASSPTVSASASPPPAGWRSTLGPPTPTRGYRSGRYSAPSLRIGSRFERGPPDVARAG